MVVDDHLIAALRFVLVHRGMGGRFLLCLDLLGQRAVRVKLFLRLLQCGKAPGRGCHPAGNEAVLIAEGPVRFLKDHKMLVTGPIFRGLPVREVLGGDGVFFCLGPMGIKCCFGLLKGIKATRRCIHRVILIVIAVLDIILAVGVLPDQDGFALPIIPGAELHLVQLTGVFLRLPPAGKFLADALIVHIDTVVLAIPHAIGDLGAAVQLHSIEADIRLRAGLLLLTGRCVRGVFPSLALFVVLLLRKGHHLVKIQVGEKFIQVMEAGALDGSSL